ncbi:MAG: transcription elongation factor GreB [Polyangiaceae bacterium]|nr:transcription elongation factor GreB [Polyangiaceae bacterium]
MVETTYLTPEGAQRLTDELRQLLERERPRVVQEVAEAAAQGDRSENAEYIYGKKRLREIDRRVRFLTKRLESAQIVRAAEVANDQIRFGARVLVENEEGEQRTYVLLGPDESDPDRGRVSFRSPIGQALLKRRVGDTVTVRRPAGDLDLTILEVSYDG